MGAVSAKKNGHKHHPVSHSDFSLRGICQQKGAAFSKESCAGRVAEAITSGGVSDGALRSLQPQPDYSSGGGNTSTSSPCVPRTYEYRSRKRWRWNRRAIHAGRRYTPCGKPNRPVRMGSFFRQAQRGSPVSPDAVFRRSMPLAKDNFHPPGPGEWFYTWGNHPSLLAGSGRSLSSPLPQLRRSIQNTFESHPFLEG